MKGGSAWVNVAPTGATLRVRLPMTKIPFPVKPWGIVDTSVSLDKWPISFGFHERHGDSDLADEQRACIAKLQAIDEAVLELLVKNKKDLYSKEPTDEALRDPINGRFTPSIKISVDKDTGMPLTSASGLTYPERMQCKIYRGDNDQFAGMRFAGRTQPMIINDIDGNPMGIDASNVMDVLREGSLVVPVIECVQLYVSPMGKANLIWKLVALTVVSIPELPAAMKIVLDSAEIDAIKRGCTKFIEDEMPPIEDDKSEEEEVCPPSPVISPVKKGRIVKV